MPILPFDESDSELAPAIITIPPISFGLYQYFETIQKTQPENIQIKLVSILRSKPDFAVHVLQTSSTVFATWTKLASKRHTTDWEQTYGSLRRDPRHDSSWAIIAAKLISIARYKHQKDQDPTEYSAQYLMDFALPKPKKKRSRCCDPNSVSKGLEYALRVNIPKEKAWKYVGCRRKSKPHNVVCARVEGEIHEDDTLDFALSIIPDQPVAAKLHVFEPDISLAKEDVYRGPRYLRSAYIRLQDVMIYSTRIVNKELVAFVKIPYGDVEYLKVSLDVMLVQMPQKDEEYHNELEEPSHLLTGFCALIPPPLSPTRG